MSVSFHEILPVGSVVKLKKADKRVMITGIIQIITETNKKFDYMGVPYPEGFVGLESQVFFQHQDIEKIFFMGFVDIERQKFIIEITKKLQEKYQKEMKNNQK